MREAMPGAFKRIVALIALWELVCCTGASSASYVNIGGSSIKVNLANVPASGTDAATVTVTLRQSGGAVLANTLVRFNAPGTVLTPGSAAMTDANGVVTTSISSTVAGPHVVTAAVLQGVVQLATGLSTSINFYVPPVANSSAITAGTVLNAQVSTTDMNPKPGSAFVGVVHFVSSDPLALLPPDYKMVAKDYGNAVLGGLVLQTPGVQTVSAIDIATGLVLSSQRFVVVATGGKLSLQLDTPTVVQAGVPFDCQVTALDAVGQLQADYQGTLTLSTTDANVAASAPMVLDGNSRGRATFRGIRLQALGQVKLTVVDTMDAVAVVAVQVVAGPAASLVVSNSGSATAGVGDDANVQVFDSFGHSAAYTGVLRFVSDDAQAVLPADFSLSAADAAGKSFTGGVIWKSAGTHVLGLRFVGAQLTVWCHRKLFRRPPRLLRAPQRHWCCHRIR